MSRPLIVVAAVCALASVAGSARADGVATYDASGDADAGAADPRVAALDDAFAHAAALALADVVAGDVRAAHKADLDREIVGHARLWVVSFKVGKDDTVDGRRQLAVAVRIDRDKLRARVVELGFAATGVAPPPDAPPTRTVTVLLRLAQAGNVRADYGANADKDIPGLAVMTGVLRRAGMTVRRAPASGPAARADGALPLDDLEAEALAGDAKAELAAIAGVTISAPAPVRGLGAPAVRLDAHVRVIVRKGHALVGEGEASTAIVGSDPGAIDAAIDRTLTAAAATLVPAGPRLIAPATSAPSRADDVPLATPGVVLIRMPAKTPWGMVETEQRYLAGARGVHGTVLRRLSPAGWVLALTTSESINQIAAIARKPPATDTAVAVKMSGDVIEVALSGSP